MGKRLAAIAWLAAAVLLVVVAGACQRSKTYRAQAFDVAIAVYENGSATITETVTFAFQGGPFTYVFREIPTGKTGGIEGLAVSEGETAYTLGSAPGQYQVQDRDGALRVTWHFPPTENMRRTFVLTYRVNGLIRQEGGQDALRWAAIPPEHSYGITRSAVTVRLPARVGPITGAQVLDGRADIGRAGQEVTFRAGDVEADQPLVIGVWFPHGQLTGVPPAWQERAMAQAARSPLWIALAGVLVVLGLAGAITAALRYGRVPAAAPAGPVNRPPSDLAPGLAGALVHNGARAPDILATLFDLGRRGVIAVEETEVRSGRRPRRSFAFMQLAAPPDLRPFEVATLDAAFSKAAADERRVSLKDLAAGLVKRMRPATRLYDAALYEAGLFGAERDRIRRGLISGGIGALVLALAPVAVAIVWGALFGLWPLLVTAALAVDGLALLLVGSAASRRKTAGEQAAGEWRAFRRHLVQMAHSRKGAADLGARLEEYLAYAVAFGLESRWTRQMAAAGARVPAWFRALSREAQAGAESAAFIAMIAAVSASMAGSAGAAAAGGAAGGGASGAG